jgi:hypothetical protein
MRTTIIIVIVAVLFLSPGCTGDKPGQVQPNALLPGRLVVFSESEFGIQGIAETGIMSRLDTYNESVIRKALANELVIHQVILSHRDLTGIRPMTVENLKECLGIIGSPDTGTVDKAIATCVKEITSGLFVEEWLMDEDRFVLQKKVIAYQPVRHFPKFFEDPATLMSQPTGDTAMIPLFSIVTDPPEEPARIKNGENGSRLLAENIRYEVGLFNRPYYEYLYTDENEIPETEVEQWANYNFNFYKHLDREKLLDIILDKVISGSVKAYDFFEQEKELDLQKIYTRLQADSIFEPVRDTVTGEVNLNLIEISVRTGEINSLIFIEDWYYLEETMGIIKIVRGVIPVMHLTLYDINSYPAGTKKVPAFLVWFNND